MGKSVFNDKYSADISYIIGRLIGLIDGYDYGAPGSTGQSAEWIRNQLADIVDRYNKKQGVSDGGA